MRKKQPQIKRPKSYEHWVRYIRLYFKRSVGIEADMALNERIINHKLAQ
mgnify:CR=1 FL=1